MAKKSSASSSKKAADLVVVTCFHLRHYLSAAWMMHTRRRLHVYACINRGDTKMAQLCEHNGITFIEHANQPLGAKFNAAMALARKGSPKAAVMLLGSDDFVSDEWLALCRKKLAEGLDYIMPTSLGVYDMRTRRACIYGQRHGEIRRFGAGRVVSPRLLETVGAPWEPWLEKGLDSSSHRKAVANGFNPHYVSTRYVPVVDVKSAVNIWSFTAVLGKSRRATVDSVLKPMDEDVRHAVTVTTFRP